VIRRSYGEKIDGIPSSARAKVSEYKSHLETSIKDRESYRKDLMDRSKYTEYFNSKRICIVLWESEMAL
jgi:hypothetical protein